MNLEDTIENLVEQIYEIWDFDENKIWNEQNRPLINQLLQALFKQYNFILDEDEDEDEDEDDEDDE